MAELDTNKSRKAEALKLIKAEQKQLEKLLAELVLKNLLKNKKSVAVIKFEWGVK